MIVIVIVFVFAVFASTLRFGMFPGSGTLYGNDDELPYYWLMDAL